MIKALIFDFDGLILETEVPDFRAWQQVYRDYGVELPLADWLQVVGSGFSSAVFDPYDHLPRKLGRSIDRDTLQRQHQHYEKDLIASLPVMPGIESLITAAKTRRMGLAIASSSDRAWVAGHLERLNLIGHFDALCTADDVAHIKPAPDLFLAALAALNVAPAEAIVFEDSSNGVIAANEAGIYTVAVPNDLTRQLDFSRADLVLDSLADITLAGLLRSANHSHQNHT